MKIKINTEDSHFTLHLPLSYWLIKPVLKKALNHDEGKSIESLLPYLKDGFSIIKEYKKENGHFTLLDVTSSSGEKVKIII